MNSITFECSGTTRMKYLITLMLLVFAVMPSQFLSAQKSAVGISVGPTLFFGDLGGANAIGRPLFFDLERSLIKPVGSLLYPYQLNSRFGFEVMGSYTSIAGDDKLLQPRSVFSPEWYRWYRNLSFHTNLWDVQVHGEYYLLRYKPGSLKDRWGPYIMLGVGMFHFNPKTEYNGTTIELKPLHTEGEGFPGSDVKNYSLYQPCIPAGVGILYNVTSDLSIGFEYNDISTFTDYIDDVSTKYVSQADFNSYFSNDPSTAALAYEVSKRSDEIDPEGIYSYVTAPGEQRGDYTDKDEYIFMQFSVHYTLGQHHIRPKNQMKCMKWGGETGEFKKRKPVK